VSKIRRLLFAILWLALIDLFVPPILQRAELRRYENGPVYRFENSDLFALGPMVRYLREHPRGPRQRALFLGNSVIFGYGLETRDALPARFEKLAGDTRAFNAAVNGAESGDSYLVARAVIDSIDTLYVQLIPRDGARSILGTLLPVDDADAQRFNLRRTDRVEATLRSLLACVWRLYAVNDRLQAAFFGTSTRQYLYLHKRDLLLAALGRAPHVAAETPSSTIAVSLSARRDGAALPRSLFDLAQLAKSHHKRLVILDFQQQAAAADFNAKFAPYAEIVTINVPQALRFDTQHLNPAGANAVAAALVAHERERAP
jgi:hypothetical protein